MKLSVENVKTIVYRAYDKASRGDVPHGCSCKELVDYVLDKYSPYIQIHFGYGSGI